jgi:hypothetical protein
MYARFILDRGHIDNTHVCGNYNYHSSEARQFSLLIKNSEFNVI